MEDFNSKLRNDVRIGLVDRGVKKAEQVAVMADEYVIIHPHNQNFQRDRSSFKTQSSVTERRGNLQMKVTSMQPINKSILVQRRRKYPVTFVRKMDIVERIVGV